MPLAGRSEDLRTLSDEALVTRVASGDEIALGEFYDRVGQTAYGLALRVLRDEQTCRGRRAGRLARRVAERCIVPRGTSESQHLDTYSRPPSRRRPRSSRGATPHRAPGRGDPRCSRPSFRANRRGRLASLRAGAGPGSAPSAFRRAAGGARARLLRWLLAVGARETTGSSARNDQEPNVLGARASARAPRRAQPRRVVETGTQRRRQRARRQSMESSWARARARRPGPRGRAGDRAGGVRARHPTSRGPQPLEAERPEAANRSIDSPVRCAAASLRLGDLLHHPACRLGLGGP